MGWKILGSSAGLVKRKWSFRHRAKRGRPPVEAALAALIVQLAKNNLGLGYEKTQGELLKLGYEISLTTVRDVFRRQYIPPAPERDHSN